MVVASGIRLRTKGSGVRIAPGAPTDTRACRHAGPYSFPGGFYAFLAVDAVDRSTESRLVEPAEPRDAEADLLAACGARQLLGLFLCGRLPIGGGSCSSRIARPGCANAIVQTESGSPIEGDRPMQSRNACRERFQSVRCDDSCDCEKIALRIADSLYELIYFDHVVESIELDLRPLDVCVGGDDDHAAHDGKQIEPQALRRLDQSFVEHALQDGCVLAVLLDGRGHAMRPSIEEPRPLAMFVDRDPLSESLGLADPYLQHSIDKNMIDLRHAAVVLDSKIVNDGPVLRIAQMEVDLVGSVPLSFLAGPDRPDLLLDRRSLG